MSKLFKRDFCFCLCWLYTNRMPGRACLTAPSKRVNKTDRILTFLSVVCLLRDITPDPATGQGAVTHLRLGFGISQLRGIATEDAVFSSECLVSLAEVLLLENQARWERL